MSNQAGRWIIWPQTKFVTDEKLRMMLSDAIANDEVSEDIKSEEVETMALDDVCYHLSDAGKITVTDAPADDSSMREQSRTERLLDRMERE